MRRLGAAPLMHQPGEQWLYTVGSNVQGVLVARISEQSLEAFFQSRIFRAVGHRMTPASGFRRRNCPAWQAPINANNGVLRLFDPPEGMFAAPPPLPAGDSGLVSTVDDYLIFA